MKNFSIVVVSHNSEDDCANLFESIAKNFEANTFQLIIIDNVNKGDLLRKILCSNKYKEFDVSIIANVYPRSFSYSNNVGVALTKYETVVLLNPDIVIQDHSLYDFLQKRTLRHGVFYYPMLLNADGTNQNHFKKWPSAFFQVMILLGTLCGIKMETKRGNDWGYAAAIVFLKETFYKIRGFDERFRLYCEDTEICHRLICSGGKVELVKEAVLMHKCKREGKSRYLLYQVLSSIYLRFAYIRNKMHKKIW